MTGQDGHSESSSRPRILDIPWPHMVHHRFRLCLRGPESGLRLNTEPTRLQETENHAQKPLAQQEALLSTGTGQLPGRWRAETVEKLGADSVADHAFDTDLPLDGGPALAAELDADVLPVFDGPDVLMGDIETDAPQRDVTEIGRAWLAVGENKQGLATARFAQRVSMVQGVHG